MNYHHLVVHCKHAPYDVYIGRESKSAPKGASCDWGNPFVMKNQSQGERKKVCEAYKEWFITQPELILRARKELKGKVLGCYCAPKDCHGHFLAQVANDDTFDVSNITIDKDSAITRKGNSLAKISDILPPPPSSSKKATSAVKDRIPVEKSPDRSEYELVDIGINVHNKQMLKTWREQIQRAVDANVTTILLTGTSLKCSSDSINLAETYLSEKQNDISSLSLYCTVGIHPHDAKSFQGEKTIDALRNLLEHPLAVAVGECGLDYNRNFSTPAQQLLCFEEHVKLACELQMPLFVHEREAHRDLVMILQKYREQLPPVVIHCFTGTAEEAAAYIDMGFYLGFTGTICKHERGKLLREMLPNIPLYKIMLETDTPFMGFVKGRRQSEPRDVVGIASKIAEVLNIDFETVCKVTTENSKTFFRI